MNKQAPKSPVDVLLTADFVVTMNPSYAVHMPGAVAVSGDTIVAVGPQEAILAAYTAAERVDAGNSVVMPGLINTHGHAPMVLLRALVDDLRLDVWLMGYVMPVEANFVNPHFCWLGTQLAAAEMIRSGVTTFMDMYYFEEAIADAAAQAGMRAVCLQSVLKFPAPDAPSYEVGLERSRDYIASWKNHPLIVPGIAPHAPYTVTPELMEAATSLALEFDAPLHIHVAETAAEVENHRREYGLGVVPWLKRLGVFEAKTTAAHCVHLDEDELETLRSYNVGVAHNPSSNMKLASGIAPIAKMLEMGINVGIGTDGAASNNDLDMIEEMRLASFLAKTATMTPTTLPARQVVEMATVMGARALHIETLTGSLEVGKRADLIVVSLEDVRHSPYFRRDADRIYSRLVYAMNQEDVRDVMVNGRWLMRGRRLLSIEVAALQEEANALAGKVDAFLIRREESPLSKLIAIGDVAQIETYEIQAKVAGADLEKLEPCLKTLPDVTILRGSQRQQYDTYFIFNDQSETRIRYREDEVRDLETGLISDVIYRLTLTNQDKENEYEHSVLLSRARFDAPATRSLRFYREYFQPQREVRVHKSRRRFHIRYKHTDFSINLDRITLPEDGGAFLEIKSRTWSRQDAERKAGLVAALLAELGIPDESLVKAEYVHLTPLAEA